MARWNRTLWMGAISEGNFTMLQTRYPYYLANRAQQPNADLDVTNKFTGERASRVALADAKVLDQAIAAASAAARPMRQLAAWQRKAVLQHVASRCRDRAEELAQQLTIEAGKPIKYSRLEVSRLIDTVEIAAEESTRIVRRSAAAGYLGACGGLPRDVEARAAGAVCAHHAVELSAQPGRPQNRAGDGLRLPVCAEAGQRDADRRADAGRNPGRDRFAGGRVFDPAAQEQRLPPRLSRTSGSKSSASPARLEVGWELRDRAHKKHVTLELGGNAACIIEHDADLDVAVERNIFGGYYQSGQSCISVQRIYVHESIYDAFRTKFVAGRQAAQDGRPARGGYVHRADDQRRGSQIASSGRSSMPYSRGGKLLCGGGRRGRMVEPAVLENVPRDADASCEEIFGPVTALAPFVDFAQAIELVNDSRYGLQAGVFTNDIDRIERAWDELEVGGVMINEVPSLRVDHMPYGGTKDSGIGREGIRWAIDSMTEVRLLVIRNRQAV